MPVLTVLLAILACDAGTDAIGPMSTAGVSAPGWNGAPARTSVHAPRRGLSWRMPGNPIPGRTQAAPPQPPRTFTGAPVSLDFEGADLRAVLRAFADISGLNIVVDPSVRGTVDVTVRDVPWDQALDAILRANKLGYVVDGPIVRVAPLVVLAEEEKRRRKLAEEQGLSGEVHIVTRASITRRPKRSRGSSPRAC